MQQLLAIRLQRLGRFRQVHTIISQETIKPSFPTPPHLKTHNLSLVDQLFPNTRMPKVLYYKNYNHEFTNIIKSSLSKCLTQYYPFAGRLLAHNHIDCDDGGVEFIEASNDNRLEGFINFKKEQDDDENTRQLAQLIPKGLGPHMVEVQLTHFACGGVVLTVSISHKVADGLTAANFLIHWATLTRGGSPKSPIFISSPISNAKLPAYTFQTSGKNKYVTKRFMFPNLKLNKLKNKINAISSTTTPLNPTRVESLTSLLFKCAVDASAIKPTSLQPLELNQLVNMRNKLVPNLSNLAAGNIITTVSAKIVDSGQMKLNEVITLLRQERMQVKEVTSIQEVGKHLENTMLNFKNDINRAYSFTSMCRFPFYEVDFGWGKPVKVTTQTANGDLNIFSLMDTPHGDGIEAIVHMKEEDMAIFREDKELLAYVEDDI